MKRRMLLTLLSVSVFFLSSPLPASAACQSGPGLRWYAGAEELYRNIWAIRGYTRVVDEYNPDPSQFFQAHRYLLGVNNGEWAEAGWAKGVPYGNTLHKYSARFKNGQYVEYDHGTVAALTNVHIRIEKGPANNRFNVYIDGVLRTVFDLNSSVVDAIEALGETSNTCASLGTAGATPDRRGRFSSMEYKATSGSAWQSWTSYSPVKEACYQESHSGNTSYIWGRCFP